MVIWAAIITASLIPLSALNPTRILLWQLPPLSITDRVSKLPFGAMRPI